MGLVVARPDLVRSLILMDTSAWSFLPPDEEIRALVHGFINAFDPAGGMPASLSMGGPEDVLIEARTPAEWRKEKDAIFAGMDAYAVKALGGVLMDDVADDDASLRAKLPSIACPTTVIVGEHDHPLVDQAPDAGRRGGRRPADRHCGGVPLAAAHARARVAGGRRGASGLGRTVAGASVSDTSPRRPATGSSSPAPTSPSRPWAWGRGPGATRAPGAWAATTSR